MVKTLKIFNLIGFSNSTKVEYWLKCCLRILLALHIELHFKSDLKTGKNDQYENVPPMDWSGPCF